jgi:sarcosine oxidase subunit delta
MTLMAMTLTCPVCGKRNGYEFRYGGEEKGPRPDEADLSPRAWCEYVHMNVWIKTHRDTTKNLEVDKPEAQS